MRPSASIPIRAVAILVGTAVLASSLAASTLSGSAVPPSDLTRLAADAPLANPAGQPALDAEGDPPSVSMRQRAVAYDAADNTAKVEITLTPQGFDATWQYEVAVRGIVRRTGSSGEATVTVTLSNNCSITTQSVTAAITDAGGHAASAAAILDRSLCPPPPDVAHATDRIIAGPTLTEASFVDRLRAVGSPALGEGVAIYRAFVGAGVNPAFALGMFHAESHSGTRGYAVTTRNWGNILYYAWTADFGAVPYAPGNGYTYASFPSWLASVRACAYLLRRYDRDGYTTVSSATAHWLGTREGSDRHLRYLDNVSAAMSLLPDDAVPRMTGLTLPDRSRSPVAVSWTARDNVAVTGYQVRTRRGTDPWSAPVAVTGRSTSLALTNGTWTVAVRATDVAGNWSRWLSDTVKVDASRPVMTRLDRGSRVVRSRDGTFTAAWGASDNVGVTAYQWRVRRGPDGAWSSPTRTTARSRGFKLSPGTWSLAVRARDAVGNWSDWRETVVVVPVDDRAFAFASGTARRTGDPYQRGTLTTTKRAGSSLTTAFTGSAFYLVGTAGPAYGRMRITIDGSSWVVDAGRYRDSRATRNHHRVLLFSVRLAAGDHTVTITNLGTTRRPTIALDALGFES